jgi:hypothetical protein
MLGGARKHCALEDATLHCTATFEDLGYLYSINVHKRTSTMHASRHRLRYLEQARSAYNHCLWRTTIAPAIPSSVPTSYPQLAADELFVDHDSRISLENVSPPSSSCNILTCLLRPHLPQPLQCQILIEVTSA